MKKLLKTDYFFLLLIVLLTSYEIVKRLNNFSQLTSILFTIGFGVLLVSAILIMIFGFDILASGGVIVTASVIPISFSLGLINKYYHNLFTYYLIFAILGFIFIFFTRFIKSRFLSLFSIIVSHGVAGLIIVFLPVYLFFSGNVNSKILLISLGGLLISVGGMLLGFLKSGKPILSEKTIFTILTPLLFLMSLFLVLGI